MLLRCVPCNTTYDMEGGRCLKKTKNAFRGVCVWPINFSDEGQSYIFVTFKFAMFLYLDQVNISVS